jgi:hypothetical protein
MRKRTVGTGLRLLVAAMVLLLIGTFFSQTISDIFFLSASGSLEFISLALFWGGILGGAAIITISVGLARSSIYNDRTRLLPLVLLLFALIILFMILFYRTLISPPATIPLRPGETIVI